MTTTRKGPNARALVKSLKALTGLNDEHSALVEHAKSLAQLVDEYPTEVKAHAEYRESLKRLLEAGKPKNDDAVARLIKELRAEK